MAARPITKAEKQTFWNDGVVCLRDMFDAEWITRMQSAVDDAVAHPGPMSLQLGQGLEGKFHGDSFVWTWQDDFRAFVFDSPAAEIAQQVLGAKERVTLFFDTLLVKQPASQAPTPWHHDQPYWPVDGDQVCTVWTPLRPCSRCSWRSRVSGWFASMGQAVSAQEFHRRQPLRRLVGSAA